MRGDLVGAEFPARVDVDQGIDGEGKGVEEIVRDRLGDLMAPAHRDVGINGCDQSDEHTMSVPAHPDLAHRDDTVN